MTAVVLVRSPLRRATDAVVDVFTSPKSGPVMVTAVLFIAMEMLADSSSAFSRASSPARCS